MLCAENKTHNCRVGLMSLALLFSSHSGSASQPADLSNFFQQNCIQCHGEEKQKGDVRFDLPVRNLLADHEFLETLVSVLEDGEMPPKKAPQPKADEVVAAVEALKVLHSQKREPTLLKRLTRSEYTNTLEDLFGVRFDLSELLPPDHVESGFDKFGEAHLMSPHQVMAYLKTARFVAERLLPEEKPNEQTLELGYKQFHGSGRGDYRDEENKAFVLSTFYPWRSNLHFSKTPGKYDRFVIPEFGRYRFKVQAKAIKSEEDEVLGINLGDPRYPTNFRKIGRVSLPAGADHFEVELTLKAGDEVSFTFDSGRTWNVGQKPKSYKGAQIRFTQATITGPIVGEWPTLAARKLLPEPGQPPGELVDHIAKVLTHRPLQEQDRNGFIQIAKDKAKGGASETAVARSVLIALLTSPHFIYKSESPELTDSEFAYRLSYFLWNSVPDEQLLTTCSLQKDPSSEVERMLKDPKADRFVEDFTRQWLQLDTVEELGPDKRVFKDVTTLQVAAMAREGTEFFRYILENDLGMELFIDSRFTLVNDRLGKFYGFKGIKGAHFRKVQFREGSARGGLIGQPGFLKLTSDAFTTSPIRRGTWILKTCTTRRSTHPPTSLSRSPTPEAPRRSRKPWASTCNPKPASAAIPKSTLSVSPWRTTILSVATGKSTAT